MIDIKSFKASLDKKERLIRDYINTPSGVIEIYEPTADDVAAIIDIERGLGLDIDTNTIAFDDVTVATKIFPLVTNITINELEEDELRDILKNPSVHLIQAKHIVAQILAEANKAYTLRLKTELIQSDSQIAQMELINAIPAAIMDRAKRDGRHAELNGEIVKLNKDIEERMADVEEQAAESDAEVPVESDENDSLDINGETDIEKENK
jgi:hypothetical protein